MRNAVISKIGGAILALALIFVMLPWQVMADDGVGDSEGNGLAAIELKLEGDDNAVTATAVSSNINEVLGCNWTGGSAKRINIRLKLDSSVEIETEPINDWGQMGVSNPIVINGLNVKKFQPSMQLTAEWHSDDDIMELDIQPELWAMLSGAGEDDEGDEEATPSKYDPSEYASVYETEKVTLSGMEVLDGDTYEAYTDPITFTFFNATKQEYEMTVAAEDGVLPDVELFKGNNYIIFADDVDMKLFEYCAYIVLNEDKGTPINYKDEMEVESLDLAWRDDSLNDVNEGRRASNFIPVYYKNADGVKTLARNVTFVLTSAEETVTVTSDEDGFLDLDLIEDIMYMVEVDSDKYAIDPFPLTFKDKSEYNQDKLAFDHFSCRNVLSLTVYDKASAHKNDTYIFSYDDKVSLAGLNFGKENKYALNERVLPKETVTGLDNDDYEVIDIDTINMERIELSKMAKGDFKVSRVVPEGKTVKNVYYVDKDGSLVKVKFEQKTNADGSSVVEFEMPAISIYNNVIEYGEPDNEPVVDGGDEAKPVDQNKPVVGEATAENVKTGDVSNLFGYTMALVVALGALAGLFAFRRREN